MSFFSNFQSDKCPGPLTGNPVAGLTEKVCIQAERVFDACIKQNRLENYTLTLPDLSAYVYQRAFLFVQGQGGKSQR